MEHVPRIKLDPPAKQDRLYKIWRHIRERCYMPNTKGFCNYGGRGIKVCDEWLGREGFLKFKEWALNNGYDYNAPRGKCTIDRIDVNGNYEPSNCRWVDNKTQCRNKRNNVILTYEKETHCLKEWSEITGVAFATLQKRFSKGWNAKDILFRKVTPNGKGEVNYVR